MQAWVGYISSCFSCCEFNGTWSLWNIPQSLKAWCFPYFNLTFQICFTHEMYDNGTYVLTRSLVTSVKDEEHRSNPISIVKPFHALEKHDPDFVLIGSLRNRFTALCFVLQPQAPLIFPYTSKFLLHLMALGAHCTGSCWLSSSKAMPARSCCFASLPALKCCRSVLVHGWAR